MKEYKDKSIVELMKLVSDKRESLRLFRFGNAGSKSKNVKEGRNLRKEIARILTTVSAANKAATKVSTK
jgi:ribosomal protein L29